MACMRGRKSFLLGWKLTSPRKWQFITLPKKLTFCLSLSWQRMCIYIYSTIFHTTPPPTHNRSAPESWHWERLPLWCDATSHRGSKTLSTGIRCRAPPPTSFTRSELIDWWSGMQCWMDWCLKFRRKKHNFPLRTTAIHSVYMHRKIDERGRHNRE